MASTNGVKDGGIGRRLRWVAGQLLPPIVAEPLRRARHRRLGAAVAGSASLVSETRSVAEVALTPPEWEYLPGGWPPDGVLAGWDVESVASTELARWPAFVRSGQGTNPLDLSPEAAGPTDVPTAGSYATHNTAMSFAYVLALTSRKRERLSVLDWGGGLGQYAVWARALLPEVDLDYHCRDLPRLTAAGRRVLPDAMFHDDDASVLGRTYDLVLASSSLQYARDWRGTLAGLARAAAGYLFVTRMPFVRLAPSFVVVQRPHVHGYRTEYPGWFLNRDEFLAEARSLGLELRREFLVDERPLVEGAPEQADYRGFLFGVPALVQA